MRKSCEGCTHYRMLYNTGGNENTKCCHYLLDTGDRRESDPAKCDKKTVNNGKREWKW